MLQVPSCKESASKGFMRKSDRDLIAWQKAMSLVAAIYDVTDSFPNHELYGLVSQLRRAAVSVPSNIAEGKEHYSSRDFVRFLRTARGSLAEIETQILIAGQRGYSSEKTTEDVMRQTEELGRILSGLISSLNKDQ